MATDLLALRARAKAYHGDEWPMWFEAAIRELARTDILAYGLYVHGDEAAVLARIAFSRHACVWWDAMERYLQTLFISPPEHGKSVLHRWYIEWWLGNQTEAHYAGKDVPVPSALLVMNAADQAEEQAMTIAATFEANERYQELFPHVEPDPKWGWTKNKLYLKRKHPRPDPSLMATGIFGPIQGKRFGMRVCDDPTDQEDAYSDLTLTKQIKRHQGVMDDRMLEGAPKRDIMTRWSRKDIPSTLMGSPEWHCIQMPCLGFWENNPEYRTSWEETREGPVPKALWPEEWPEERLEAKRREKLLTKDSELWQLAWMCNPVAAEGEMIRRAWLREYQPSIFGEAA